MCSRVAAVRRCSPEPPPLRFQPRHSRDLRASLRPARPDAQQARRQVLHLPPALPCTLPFAPLARRSGAADPLLGLADLAPEHIYPSQQIEVLAGYHHLVNELGVPEERICVGGDSAGGNLVAGFLLHLARPSRRIKVPKELGPTPRRPGVRFSSAGDLSRELNLTVFAPSRSPPFSSLPSSTWSRTTRPVLRPTPQTTSTTAVSSTALSATSAPCVPTLPRSTSGAARRAGIP